METVRAVLRINKLMVVSLDDASLIVVCGCCALLGYKNGTWVRNEIQGPCQVAKLKFELSLSVGISNSMAKRYLCLRYLLHTNSLSEFPRIAY